MKDIYKLLQNNCDWVDCIEKEDFDFFYQLVKQQYFEYLWIGCFDLCVLVNQIIGMVLGEVFVYCNVVNVVVYIDFNCLSVVQYVVDQLKVKYILIVGYYGCGGVYVCLYNICVGLVDNWLCYVGDVVQKYQGIFDVIEDDEFKYVWLCELNVIEQVVNFCCLIIVLDVWVRGQKLMVYGWVYSLKDGCVCEMGIDVGLLEELQLVYEKVLFFVLCKGCCD